MNIIRKAKISADRRSVDAYGRSVELAIATYLLDTGTFPTDLSSLTIEYTGKEVVCNVMAMKENGGIYLSECTVGGKQVKDNSTEDGYYHYGTRDLTNEEYVDMYGLALKNASVAYYEENGNSVEDYTTLTIDYKGKTVACDVTVNYDGTIYMTKCKVNNVDVTDENEEDGYYHYGSIVNPPTAVDNLLSKVNPLTVTNYNNGNKGEMYTFEHSATVQTPALTDYRYIGANPNNYVTFNNELWRIIGVFTVEDENGNTEQRIKIIKGENLPDEMFWNADTSTNINSTNDWNNSTINTYLNVDYYNSILNDYKDMIGISKFYLGGERNTKDGAGWYNSERGDSVVEGRSISWIGKIALIYESDYTYTYAKEVHRGCFSNVYYCGTSYNGSTNGWIHNMSNDLYKWLINPHSTDESQVHYIDANGSCYSNSVQSSKKYVYPVLYLKSSVKIISGDGSEQSPYQLSL